MGVARFIRCALAVGHGEMAEMVEERFGGDTLTVRGPACVRDQHEGRILVDGSPEMLRADPDVDVVELP